MDVEYLMNKLEPLIPTKIQHWRRTKDSADADLNRLIDQEIAHEAHRILGDFRSKILLSLPPEKKGKGTFHLGTIHYEKPKWPLGLSSGELLQNVAIFGRSGAGKTNVVFHLIQQLSAKKIPWLFLDWKRTARHLLPQLKNKTSIYTPGRALAPLMFNPFIVPPGLEANVYVNHVVDVLSEAFTLGEGSRSLVQKALAACYAQGSEAPTIQNVTVEIESMSSTGRTGGWKVSALRALNSVAFGELATTRTSQDAQARSLLNGQTIIELDALSDSTKRFLVPILCLWLYTVKLSAPEREKLSMVIFVEEAHHVLYRNEQRTKETMMNRLLRQCRELGIAMVVVDQHPHLISSAALGNTYTSICLNLKDPSDINRASGLSQVEEREKRYFSMLPVGQGIVKLQDRWRKPMLVHFPLVEVAKGSVSDAMLSGFVDDKLTQKDMKKRVRELQGASKIGKSDRFLSEDEYLFLHDVSSHSADGVRARYGRLGWSVERGQKVKDCLVQHGWLLESTEKLGQTRRHILRLPKEAHELGRFEARQNSSASPIHDYWQRHYAAKFLDEGFKVTMEAPRQGGCVDVLAEKDGKRIGIEVETGKSDVVANVKNGLLSRFDAIMVVCTDAKALARVERQLAKEGLLGLARVKVVLRDGLDVSAWAIAS